MQAALLIESGRFGVFGFDGQRESFDARRHLGYLSSEPVSHRPTVPSTHTCSAQLRCEPLDHRFLAALAERLGATHMLPWKMPSHVRVGPSASCNNSRTDPKPWRAHERQHYRGASVPTDDTPRKVSDYFGAPSWEPVCAVGGHGPGVINAQICVSISGASIVPEQPRLVVMLWQSNYTHELVAKSGSMTITMLGSGQLHLLEPLGLGSGRGMDKLKGIDVRLSASGDPYFPNSVGYADCLVLDQVDLGDCTAFFVGVRSEERFSSEEPVTWQQARESLDADFLARYESKFRHDRERAASEMRWLNG